jgi:hypothetical protein
MWTGAILAGGAIIIANEADRLESSGVRVIADLVPDGGALDALYTGVHAAPSDRPGATYTRRCAPELRQVIGERPFRLSDIARIPGLRITG